MRHNGIDCMWTLFLQSAFSDAISNCVQRQMHSRSGCIWMIFLWDWCSWLYSFCWQIFDWHTIFPFDNDTKLFRPNFYFPQQTYPIRKVWWVTWWEPIKNKFSPKFWWLITSCKKGKLKLDRRQYSTDDNNDGATPLSLEEPCCPLSPGNVRDFAREIHWEQK